MNLQRAALISVTDKTGIVEIAQCLVRHGFIILSTGGTAKLLREEGIQTIDVAEYTGFPEMMGGRLKTLHPMVHGGILGRTEDVEIMYQWDMFSIDVVIVNLYPFAQTIAQPGCTFETAVENIDIGGPTMLRAAAKNYTRVTVICDTNNYELVQKEMDENDGAISNATRRILMQKAFEHTAEYDKMIEGFLFQELGSAFPRAG